LRAICGSRYMSRGGTIEPEVAPMNAVRIRTRIDSETLTLPELRPLMGKAVEIIVLEDDSAGASVGSHDLSFFTALTPPRPEPTAADRAELQRMAEADPSIRALLELSDSDTYDFDAAARIRTASPT